MYTLLVTNPDAHDEPQPVGEYGVLNAALADTKVLLLKWPHVTIDCLRDYEDPELQSLQFWAYRASLHDNYITVAGTHVSGKIDITEDIT